MSHAWRNSEGARLRCRMLPIARTSLALSTWSVYKVGCAHIKVVLKLIKTELYTRVGAKTRLVSVVSWHPWIFK